MTWQPTINSRGKLWNCWQGNLRQAVQMLGDFPGYFWIAGNVWGIEENLQDAIDAVTREVYKQPTT